jgi:hypothetical protein
MRTHRRAGRVEAYFSEAETLGLDPIVSLPRPDGAAHAPPGQAPAQGVASLGRRRLAAYRSDPAALT